MPNAIVKKLLQRQLKKHGMLSSELPNDKKAWSEFLARVEQTYAEYDAARLSSDNILDVSVREMERLQREASDYNRQKLIEMNEYIGLVLQASELGVWDWDLTNDQVVFDQRWTEMLGLPYSNSPQGFEIFEDHLHPDDRLRVLAAATDHVLKKAPKYAVQFRMKHAKGHWVDIFAKGKITSYDKDGKPLRFIGLHLDITEIEQLRREMEAQRLALVHASKMACLGEISAGIAHEINNPLAIIMGATDTLVKHLSDPEKLKARLDSLKKSSLRIARIVSGLKKFSRSAERSERRPFALRGVVEESVALTETKAKLHSVVVSVNCKTDGWVDCNEIEIEQVLVNLINNGIDAIEPLDERWIQISLIDEGSHVVLRVRDSGNGIAPAIREKLFQPFFTTKDIGKGTGLGLSIVKGIVDEHNGSIEIVASDPNTCFEIKFPRVSEQPIAA